MNIKIEKGIPFPQTMCDILRKMEIGDSAVFHTSISSLSSMATKTLGKGCFTCKSEEGGIRLWRTK